MNDVRLPQVRGSAEVKTSSMSADEVDALATALRRLSPDPPAPAKIPFPTGAAFEQATMMLAKACHVALGPDDPMLDVAEKIAAGIITPMPKEEVPVRKEPKVKKSRKVSEKKLKKLTARELKSLLKETERELKEALTKKGKRASRKG